VNMHCGLFHFGRASYARQNSIASTALPTRFGPFQHSLKTRIMYSRPRISSIIERVRGGLSSKILGAIARPGYRGSVISPMLREKYKKEAI
jgi:hypothetical protein